MANLMTASRQWATRPVDERFWNLSDLESSLQADRTASLERDVQLGGVEAVAVDKEVCLSGGKSPAKLTNWAFSQLAVQCDAPASYLRKLPAPMAADCLNYGLRQRGSDDETRLLLNKKADSWTVRAMNSTTYGRIWNLDVVRFLKPALESGWRVPPARPAGNDDSRARPATQEDILPNQGDFGLSVRLGDTIAPAGVYAGDRDMFVFLVNPSRIVDDGGKGLMKGIFVWNSEVGAGAFKVRSFYLENVCGNHICWGASGVKDFRIIHKERAIIGYQSKMMRQLSVYCEESAAEDERRIVLAKQTQLGLNKAEVIAKLSNLKSLLMSQKDTEAAFVTAERWEHTAGAAPTSIWGFVHGLTRFSQTFPYADERHKLDIAAGKILAMAA